jgi:excisionase family DNA binding protein
MGQPIFLTAKATAALYGISLDTFYRWVEAGYLQAEQTGERGRFRVPVDSLPDNVKRCVNLAKK